MSEFQWVAIAIVTIISASRITRLITWDVFPPAVWLRMRWDKVTKDGSWAVLAHCGYCFSFWATLGVVLWGYLSDWNTVWWLANGTLAASYVAAVFMTHDGDDG